MKQSKKAYESLAWEALGQAGRSYQQKTLRQVAVKFCKKHAAIIKQEHSADFDFDQWVIKSGSLSREKLANLCFLPFSTRNLYYLFLESLPPTIKIIWEQLIWENTIKINDAIKEYKISIFASGKDPLRSYFYYSDIREEYQLLLSTDSYYATSMDSARFVLPFGLRSVIAKYYDLPESAKLIGMQEAPATEFQYLDAEASIMAELPRLYTYYKQKQIDFTVKERPAATGLSKIHRNLQLREFFPEASKKQHKFLRTNILATLIYHWPQKTSIDQAATIQTYFNSLFKNKTYTAAALLPDLKGMGNVDLYYLNKVEAALLDLLGKLPGEAWVDMNRIEQHTKFLLINLKGVSLSIADEKLYFELDIEEKALKRYNEDRKYINDTTYRQAIELPILKGAFFLFAAMGLCELAYDEVKGEIGVDAYSAWDGLKAVKRTPLGDYVCGLSNNYELQISSKGGMTLSPETLLITIDGPESGMAGILAPYAEKISPNRYRSDSQIFLKNIRSKSELDSKIILFRQLLKTELPPNWEQFLVELQQKMNPFEKAGEMSLYKIPAANKTLIQLIAQDPVLKNLVIKAENYHILVPKANNAAFKRRLQEFGYLLT